MKKLIIMSAILAGAAAMQARSIVYPQARQVDTVDNYFGIHVPDPYRWLEDDNSAETAQWVEAENKLTQDYLKRIPFRDKVRKRLTQLANYEKMGAPFKVKGKYYFYRNDGLQNQSVLYVKDALDGEARVVLDPNTLSADGTVALQSIDFSGDGRYLAYVITRNGSDWNEIFVKDLETGQLLPDHIEWAKFTGAEWLGNGFFYSAYDKPEDARSSKNEFHKVYYHRLGTPQSDDYVELENRAEPLMFHQVSVVDDVKGDERFLFAWVSDGDGNALYVKDRTDINPHYICLADDMHYQHNPIGVQDGKIYVMTNDGAPRWKVVAYDLNNLGKGRCADFVAEREWVLSDARMAGGQFILSYDRDASTHPYVYDAAGREVREISLPTFGSVGFSCRKNDPEVFYSFTSYTFPTSIYKYDLATGQSQQLFAPKVALTPSDYVTEQVFYPSKDGTRVPMFLIYKKGMKRDGKRPVFLYGYGGFNISMNPAFSYTRTPFALLDKGGIAAFTCLRGGGEYGEEWHRAGTKMQKQNVFDDFIAAAEWLIAEGYSAPRKIACNGGSNGGLLVGAVVNQRPDLWGAAVPQVGVMDMLRYHQFTIGWNWAPDYGRSDDSKEMFEYLRGYSPLHTIKNDGTVYPPILVTTSDHDDRVVPAHSFKYAAALQAANTGDAPKLIRIDTNAGHGHGKPVSKIIDEYTDVQSFILYSLGVKF
ncbi:MAG: S9 family peptidase [Muribaculaceae bacterium]|nr:S9 family peptidase [Muribaculaceae bacterium]